MAEEFLPTPPSQTSPASTPQMAHQSTKYYQMGSFSDRLVALLIDGFIVGFITAVIVFVSGIAMSILTAIFADAGNLGNIALIGMGFLQMVLSFGIIATAFFYYVYFYTKKGQTPGKKLLHLKLISSDNGKYLGVGSVLVRQFVKSFFSAFLYLGYLWFFMSENRQTWHDSSAHSYVVKTDEAGNILMDGPKLYPKEPVKTFLPLGIMVIVIGLSMIMVASVMAVMISNIAPTYDIYSDVDNDNYEYDVQDEDQKQQFLDLQTELDKLNLE